MIYDFSIRKEFICNINCRIFSAIHSLLKKLSTWLMVDNKKIKALKNSRKKENKINNAPCTFQNRIGNDVTPG